MAVAFLFTRGKPGIIPVAARPPLVHRSHHLVVHPDELGLHPVGGRGEEEPPVRLAHHPRVEHDHAVLVWPELDDRGLLFEQEVRVSRAHGGRVITGEASANTFFDVAPQVVQRHLPDLVVVVLERDRHAALIADIRAAGARIRLITDGDLSAGISAAVVARGDSRRSRASFGESVEESDRP